MIDARASAPLLASEQPRFSGVNVEFGSFTASGERLLLVGDWRALFQLCAGKLELESGQVLIQGCAAQRAVVAGRVGLALADAPLPASWSVLEVLRQSGRLWGFGAREATERASTLASEVGLEKHLSKPLAGLGAAERRAVRLLAAGLGDPPVLVVEEPFASLEPSDQDFIARVLEQLLRGRAGLIAVREPPRADARLGWLRAADEVLVLGPRGLCARGRRSELEATSSGYRVVVLRQVEALSARLVEAGYRVLEGRAASGLGLAVADPNHRGTGPLVAAALHAGAPIVELAPLWPGAALDPGSSRKEPSEVSRAPTDGGG